MLVELEREGKGASAPGLTVGDVKVDLEVEHVADALVGEGVQALKDEHLAGGSVGTSTRTEVGRARMTYLQGEG